MNRLSRCLLRYGAAILAVLLAVFLARWPRPLAPACSPLFMAAVTLSALYGGLGPGLLATALSALALDCFVFPPVASHLTELTRLGVFALVALLITSLYSARRRAEEALAQTLAREQAALAEAEAANAHKDRFLTFLSHELRTPLATISNVVHALSQGRASPAEEWGRDILDRQVHYVSRLLDYLLEVSRIGRGKIVLRPERLDLKHLLQTTAEDHRGMLARAGLTLRLELPEEPVWTVGDPTRLAQVLSNLLVNASKFTDPGGSITLRLALPQDRQWAAVTVRDTGLGIEPAVLPYVFDLFVQDERTRDHCQGGARPGSGPGQGVGGTARRPGGRRQRRPRTGSRVYGLAPLAPRNGVNQDQYLSLLARVGRR